jgi:hypothetical protein
MADHPQFWTKLHDSDVDAAGAAWQWANRPYFWLAGYFWLTVRGPLVFSLRRLIRTLVVSTPGKLANA